MNEIMPRLQRKEYLGDGAYCGWTEWGDLIIFTTDGVIVQNEICLDTSCWDALLRCVDRRAKIHAAMAERQAEPDDNLQTDGDPLISLDEQLRSHYKEKVKPNSQLIENRDVSQADGETADPFLKGIMERDDSEPIEGGAEDA